MNKPVETSQLSELVSKYSPILAEVKKRVVITISVFVLAALAGFIFYENIVRFLISALSLNEINIVFTSPFQFINLAFNTGLATGLVVVMPLLIFQILYFLKPALKLKEFKMVVRFLPFSVLLFLVGFGFGAGIMKWQIDIFLARATSLGIGNVLDISSLLSVVLLTSVLMGIGFQFPIILLILIRLGIVKHEQLAKKRKWVYLVSFVITLFLPPDSILADILLAMPFILSFEATLVINRIIERKKK